MRGGLLVLMIVGAAFLWFPSYAALTLFWVGAIGMAVAGIWDLACFVARGEQ